MTDFYILLFNIAKRYAWVIRLIFKCLICFLNVLAHGDRGLFMGNKDFSTNMSKGCKQAFLAATGKQLGIGSMLITAVPSTKEYKRKAWPARDGTFLI